MARAKKAVEVLGQPTPETATPVTQPPIDSNNAPVSDNSQMDEIERLRQENETLKAKAAQPAVIQANVAAGGSIWSRDTLERQMIR